MDPGTPARFGLSGYDEGDERLAFEESRSRFVGEVEWRPPRRLRPLEDHSGTG